MSHDDATNPGEAAPAAAAEATDAKTTKDDAPSAAGAVRKASADADGDAARAAPRPRAGSVESFDDALAMALGGASQETPVIAPPPPVVVADLDLNEAREIRQILSRVVRKVLKDRR